MRLHTGVYTVTRKRVCTESWLCEKNSLPHRGIEPTSAAWWCDALTNWPTSPPKIVYLCVRVPVWVRGHVCVRFDWSCRTRFIAVVIPSLFFIIYNVVFSRSGDKLYQWRTGLPVVQGECGLHQKEDYAVSWMNEWMNEWMNISIRLIKKKKKSAQNSACSQRQAHTDTLAS